MKLFFCDICNESIPLQDIKENVASTIKGKIFCQKCNPLNEVSASDGASHRSAPSPFGGRLMAGVGVLLVLVLVLVGIGYLIVRDAAQGSGPVEVGTARLDAMEGQLLEVSQAVAVLQGDTGAGDVLSEFTGRLTALEQDLAARTTQLTRTQGEVDDLEQALRGSGDLREDLGRVELRHHELLEKLDQLGARLGGVEGQVRELEGRPPVVVAASAVPSDETESGEGSVEPDEELLEILEKLTAKEAMERWEAVDQIRRRRDKALVPYVLPLLDDRDTFVRAQAIYTLGELRAFVAVAKLVKLLRDDELMIREESLTSLVVITGQNFRFDVDGSRSVREKGIRRWETWLVENKDKL